MYLSLNFQINDSRHTPNILPIRPPRNKEEESCLESACRSAQTAEALPAASPNCSPVAACQDALSGNP